MNPFSVLRGVVVFSVIGSSPASFTLAHAPDHSPAPAPQASTVAASHPAGELVVKLKADYPLRAGYVRTLLESEGVRVKSVAPVFTAAHEAVLDGKTEEEALVDTLRRLNRRAPERRLSRALRPRGLGAVFRVAVDEISADVQHLAFRLSGLAAIEYAEPNVIMKTALVPNDPYYHSSGTWGQSYDDLWGLKKIQCEGAWDETTGNPGVVIAIVDTGILSGHEDLAGAIWTNADDIPGDGVDNDGNGFIDDVWGWDFCTMNGKSRDNDPADDHGHGTHCAGTAAAVIDNSIGVAGVAGHSKVMTLKALDVYGNGLVTDLADAIVYAADNGAAVISNSWGGYGWKAPQVLADAVAYAHDLGCVVVAAAGNASADALVFSPANMREVITVSAFDPADQRASFSNWGVKIDVAAPGDDILSCLAPGTTLAQRYPERIVGEWYLRLNGTSMATPHVAGLAALLLANDPSLTNEEIRQILRTSADDVGDVGWDVDSGYGRINASAALGLRSALTARITAPWHRDYAKGVMSIHGTAAGSGFRDYRVEYGSGLTPAAWTLIAESSSEVVDGVLATWDTSGLADGDYTLRLVAVARKGVEFSDRVLLWKDSALRPGWPVEMSGPVYSSPAVADIDGAAGQEIVVDAMAVCGAESCGLYYALTDGGDLSPGDWPKEMPDQVANTPAIADIDHDGSQEIIALHLGYREVHVWRPDGTPLAGFPVDVSNGVVVHMGGGFMSDVAPTLANIDADQDLEIIVPSNGKVWAINPDGTAVGDWPVTLFSGPGFPLGAPAVAVGDLDRDGAAEIVVYSGYEENEYPYGRHFQVQVFNHDGTPMEDSLWPVASDTLSVLSAPTLGDLDGDGDLEVLIGGMPEPGSGAGYVHAWHHDGAPVTNWPVPVGYDSLTDPVLADLEGDGRPEVLVATTAHKLYAFRGNGTKVFDVSVTVGGAPHPVVADVDADGSVNIVHGGFYGDVHAWRPNGAATPGWPRRTRDLISTSPALDDLDGDGLLEVVVGSKDERLYAWNLSVPFERSLAEWPTYRQSTRRTGRYVPPLQPCSAPPPEVRGVEVTRGELTRVAWSALARDVLYDVAGGLASELRADGGVGDALCLAEHHPDPQWADLAGDPPVGDARYYIIRGRNGCGAGSYGVSSAGAPRVPASDCP